MLRRKAREIKEVTDHIRELEVDMWETMYSASGVGLAAPQVGVLRRLIVIDVTEPEEEEEEGEKEETGGDKPAPEEKIPHETIRYTLINPEIIEVSDEKVSAKEGCLSVPGKAGVVERPARVRVRAKDINGKTFEVEGEGMLAKALQHEIDHLEGVLYTDIAESVEEIKLEDGSGPDEQ